MLAQLPARRARAGAAQQLARFVGSWATADPGSVSGANPANVLNLVAGEWRDTAKHISVPDPYTGEPFLHVADTARGDEARPFVAASRAVPKTGLHNPFRNPERYLMYGDVCTRVVAEMRKPEVSDFFARWIQRTSPKSYAQAQGEVRVTLRFFENFCGDQVRFLARGFHVPGDHGGQQSNGYRFPYGAVALVTPFNFPLEIPALQLMGALFMGNRPLLHCDHKVSVVFEQFLRLLAHCGMPLGDVDFLNGRGAVMNQVMTEAEPRSTLFTGSKRVAEKLALDTRGKVYLEDAGFDWKVLGPDVGDAQYVAHVADQDAYACSGQKCSAQSILFMHDNWADAGLERMLKERAAARTLEDVTVGPVLTWTTRAMLDHVDRLLQIPGARLAFGGKPLTGHSIPECYGAIEPTAVFVPLQEALKPQHWDAVTTEVFGPLQVLTQWGDGQLDLVLQACERMDAHLTAAVVSNDIQFVNRVLANTVNGTTYVGRRARTTGAPQNHWFGPAGDPRAAGIGTPEAIRLVWSCHREVIHDWGPAPQDATFPTT